MVTPPMNAELAVREKQTQNAASWFYWIAGLTVVNVVVGLFGSDWSFVLSLAGPTLAAEMAHEAHSTAGMVAAVVFSLVCVGGFAALGYFGSRGARWALITGMVLFGLDALLWLVGQAWLAIALHAYALWRIGAGLAPAKRLAELRRQAAMPAAATPWYGGPTSGAPADSGQWPPAPISPAAPQTEAGTPSGLTSQNTTVRPEDR